MKQKRKLMLSSLTKIIWLKGNRNEFCQRWKETLMANDEWFSIVGDEHFDTILRNKIMIWIKEIETNVEKNEKTLMMSNKWFFIFESKHFDLILKNKFQKKINYEQTNFIH